jgi:toluene monooxygenase electron transfer component
MSEGGDSPSPRHLIQIDGGPAFEVAADEDSLLRGALRAGIGFPHECSVGGCGACRFELLEGPMETLWPEAPGLSDRERKRGRRLACQSRPLGSCRIKVRCDAASRPPVAPRRMTATVIERRALTPDMMRFTLEVPGGAPFLPGQYALLYLPGVRGARAYSMSNLPGADDTWQFVIRRVPGGQGSRFLFEHLEPGDSLPLDGPYGQAYLRPGPRDVVCIAGGSGLAPMLSVARGVLAENGTRTVHFFLGLRTQSDICLADDVTRLAGARLNSTVVLSEPSPEPAWDGATGFVHAEVERALGPTLGNFDHYFAGPPPMVEAVQEMLMVRHGVPFDQIHFDRFF